MTVTFLNLVGSREPPDKTIRYRLSVNWNNANTLSKSPTFQSDSEEPDVMATDDMADENLVTVRWLSSFREPDPENEPNGDTIHHWKHRLAIDLWGETQTMALLMQDEINRIIWEIAPKNNVALVKSDGSNSEADYFEKNEIDFQRIQPESKIDNRPSYGGILEIHFRKLKS